MLLIRSSVYFLFLVLSTTLVGLAIVLVGWLLPFRQRSSLANLWGGVNMWALRVICGLRYEAHGIEEAGRSGVIYLSKHQSAWETLSLRHLIQPEQAWVLKRELIWIPVFGWALAMATPIAINRKSGRAAIRQVLRQGMDRLEKGRAVVIFPEGTRVAPGERKKYGAGGALLAEKSGRPVVPVAHNAGVFWRRRGLIKYPGTIHLVFGPPMRTEGLSASAINRQVEAWIEGVVALLPQDNRTPLDRDALRAYLAKEHYSRAPDAK